MLMESLDNYLGDLKMFEMALNANQEAVLNYLKQPLIGTLDRAYYRVAWNAYELASTRKKSCEALRKQWMDAFRASEILADFSYDEYIVNFLQKKRDKYLF